MPSRPSPWTGGKRMKRRMPIAGWLLIGSFVIAVLQFLIFKDARNMAFYLLQDLLFLPLSLMFITLVLDNLIKRREKQEHLERSHILVSEFYSEFGIEILHDFNRDLRNLPEWKKAVCVQADWKEKDFEAAMKKVSHLDGDFDVSGAQLIALFEELGRHKTFIMTYFHTPTLGQHDEFMQMLWAVYHVWDELKSRDDLSNLPHKDLLHLQGDLLRAYRLLVKEWLRYMAQLRQAYPYLFSMASRKNPFTDEGSMTM